MASIDDINSTLKGLSVTLSALTDTVQNSFPRINGTFTLANATSTSITQVSVRSNSLVLWTPLNAAAALTLRSQGLFLSTRTPGTSFSVSTQTGMATGSETFQYVIINP